MRKWKRVLILTSAIAAMGIFTACTAKTGAETTAATTATADDTTTGGTTAKQPETMDERELVASGEGYGNPVVDLKKMFEDFSGLIGQTDDKTTALLGDGIIEPTEGEPVSAREYTMKVFGADTITDVFYDGDKVSMLQLSPEGIDRAACTEQINKALGTKGTEETSSNDGSEIHTVTWTLKNSTIMLRDAFDMVSIEIVSAE